MQIFSWTLRHRRGLQSRQWGWGAEVGQTLQGEGGGRDKERWAHWAKGGPSGLPAAPEMCCRPLFRAPSQGCGRLFGSLLHPVLRIRRQGGTLLPPQRRAQAPWETEACAVLFRPPPPPSPLNLSRLLAAVPHPAGTLALATSLFATFPDLVPQP